MTNEAGLEFEKLTQDLAATKMDSKYDYLNAELGHGLLPCPFCGGEAEYNNDTGYNDEYFVEWIECKTCYSKANDVKSWNTRATPSETEKSPQTSSQPIDAWGNVPEGWTLIPLDSGERLGESFLRTLFGPEFDTPYVARLNAVVQTASKLPKPPGEASFFACEPKSSLAEGR